jgi:hypothetical protein
MLLFRSGVLNIQIDKEFRPTQFSLRQKSIIDQSLLIDERLRFNYDTNLAEIR